MAMTTHKVAGVYASREAAVEGVRALGKSDFGEDEVMLVGRGDWERVFADSEQIGERAARGALAGAGTGAGLGAAGAAALVSVIAAPPVLALLAGAGLGAVAGTAIAGISSASVRESDFQDMVREAAERGQFVVVVRAGSEADALKAQDAIARTAEASLDQYGGVTD